MLIILSLLSGQFSEKCAIGNEFSDTPSKRCIPDVREWTLERKRGWIHAEVKAFLSNVFQRTSFTEDVIMLDEAHRHGFECRQTGCEQTFPLHSARVRYILNLVQ